MATTAEETRSRILEAAWTLVRERGTRGMTLSDVAAAAGVSRQLLYFHFGGRAGLLVAMTRHHDERSGFLQAVRATRRLPPVEGFEALLAAWLDYIPEILPVARALEAGSIDGGDEASAWRDRMTDLREAFRVAVHRVDRAGHLAPGWTVTTATDWIWARCHVTTWQHLVAERGWSEANYAERTRRSIRAELLA